MPILNHLVFNIATDNLRHSNMSNASPASDTSTLHTNEYGLTEGSEYTDTTVNTPYSHTGSQDADHRDGAAGSDVAPEDLGPNVVPPIGEIGPPNVAPSHPAPDVVPQPVKCEAGDCVEAKPGVNQTLAASTLSLEQSNLVAAALGRLAPPSQSKTPGEPLRASEVLPPRYSGSTYIPLDRQQSGPALPFISDHEIDELLSAAIHRNTWTSQTHQPYHTRLPRLGNTWDERADHGRITDWRYVEYAPATRMRDYPLFEALTAPPPPPPALIEAVDWETEYEMNMTAYRAAVLGIDTPRECSPSFPDLDFGDFVAPPSPTPTNPHPHPLLDHFPLNTPWYDGRLKRMRSITPEGVEGEHGGGDGDADMESAALSSTCSPTTATPLVGASDVTGPVLVDMQPEPDSEVYVTAAVIVPVLTCRRPYKLRHPRRSLPAPPSRARVR